MNFLEGKKTWLGIIGFAITFLVMKLGLPIDDAQVANLAEWGLGIFTVLWTSYGNKKAHDKIEG